MKQRHDEIVSNLPRDLASLPRLDGFRLRGLETTRLETLLDAAFAFAMTTLVIAAQQIPHDIATLLAAFRNLQYRGGLDFLARVTGSGAGAMDSRMALRS